MRRTRECVNAIPGAELAETVVGIGNCSSRDTDKFARFNLASALTGFVPTYPQKLAAERVAMRIKGVKGLAQEIQVRHHPGTGLHAPMKRPMDWGHPDRSGARWPRWLHRGKRAALRA